VTRVGLDGKQHGNGGRSGDNVSGTQSDGSGDYNSEKRRSAAANTKRRICNGKIDAADSTRRGDGRNMKKRK
jgi:hypothetical protein